MQEKPRKASRTRLKAILAANAVVSALVFAGLAQPAQATPVEIQALNLYSFIDNVGPNGPGGNSSAIVLSAVGGDFVPNPPGASETFGAAQSFAAQTSVTASQGGITTTLPYLNSPALPYQWFTYLPFSPSFTGSWQLSVTNSSLGTSNFATAALPANTPVLPLIANFRASSTTPGATVSWTPPAVSVPAGDTLEMSLFVLGLAPAGGVAGYSVLDSVNLPSNAASYDLSSLPNGALSAGQSYLISVNPVLVDATGRELSTSATFLAFSPAVPETSTWAMLMVGFAGLGFVARRTRRRSALA